MNIDGILCDAGVSDKRRKTLAPIITECEWIREQLVAVREELRGEPFIVEYTNGNGLTSDRENILIGTYEKLWKSYVLGMGKILDALPKEKAAAVEDPEELKPSTVLEFVRDKHRKKA